MDQSLFPLLRWIELSCIELIIRKMHLISCYFLSLSWVLVRCIVCLVAFQIYLISISILANVIFLWQTYYLKPSFNDLYLMNIGCWRINPSTCISVKQETCSFQCWCKCHFCPTDAMCPQKMWFSANPLSIFTFFFHQ